VSQPSKLSRATKVYDETLVDLKLSVERRERAEADLAAVSAKAKSELGTAHAQEEKAQHDVAVAWQRLSKCVADAEPA